MITVFVSVLQFIAVVNALVRSVASRFVVGAIGGIARLALLLTGAMAAIQLARLAGADVPSSTTAMAVAATVLGPVVTFGVLWIAHRRKADVPAAQEELLSRPFNAWFPAALFDAAFVVINVLATVFAARAG